MIRKQGGYIGSIIAKENVVDKCTALIREKDPNSLANKLLHITIKTDPNTPFTMDGFDFITDSDGNFSSLAIAGTNTPEIHSIVFNDTIANAVLCFMY